MKLDLTENEVLHMVSLLTKHQGGNDPQGVGLTVDLLVKLSGEPRERWEGGCCHEG